MNSEETSFIRDLVREVRNDPLRDTILLAPSLRVARQWLDRAAALCGGFANVRGATLRGLMMEYAAPVLRARGKRIASREEKIRLVGEALSQRHGSGDDSGYFSRLTPTASLAETVLRTIEELEESGALLRDGAPSFSTSREKREELAALMRRYDREKRYAGFAGQDDIAAAALAALAEGGSMPMVLLPASVEENALAGERRFLRRWDPDRLLRLPEESDPPSARLRFFRADTPATEARGVFRLLQREGLPLDRVEVVCADENVYAEYLCLAALEAFGGPPEDLPLTFNGGVPAWRSRPARMLAAWLTWLEDDLPPEGLARMVESGLLDEGWRQSAPNLAAHRLAARLRALPINGGPGDYRRQLGRDDRDDELRQGERWLARLLPAILPLAKGGDTLDTGNATAVLEAAGALLGTGAATDGKLDAYARRALREAVAAWIPHAGWSGFNALSWLARQAETIRVMGLGPLPGKLYVADLATGGHSGRPYTFVVGLDDNRFPGGSRQDPVLLDKERRQLSHSLALSRVHRERRERAMGRLLGRLKGTIFLSHALHDGRDTFPSVLYSRLCEKEAAGSVFLRPDAPAECLNRRDDWLLALLPDSGASPGDLAPWFPHLERGAHGTEERASPRFTAWDGHVPEAGADFFREGRPLSPTHLEELAACPLEFFFKRVLRIRPPDRYKPLPGRWLPGNERGNLLHDLFQDFLGRMMEEGWTLDGKGTGAGRDLLLELLEKSLRRYRRKRPPHDELAYERERGELLEACAIFLACEADRQTRGRPLCLEAAPGGAKEDDPPWNFRDPVELPLPTGATLRLQGRVDRIDRLHDHGGLVIWDYKTGQSSGFSRSDPFRQGRHLQPYLYGEMIIRTLARQGRPEPVHCFSYFFPMPRDEGRTFTYPWSELREGGLAVVARLASMLAAGVFPFTTTPADVAHYSDYRPIYGDMTALAEGSKQKALAGTGGPLAAWAALRGLGDSGEGKEE